MGPARSGSSQAARKKERNRLRIRNDVSKLSGGSVQKLLKEILQDLGYGPGGDPLLPVPPQALAAPPPAGPLAPAPPAAPGNAAAWGSGAQAEVPWDAALAGARPQTLRHQISTQQPPKKPVKMLDGTPFTHGPYFLHTKGRGFGFMEDNDRKCMLEDLRQMDIHIGGESDELTEQLAFDDEQSLARAIGAIKAAVASTKCYYDKVSGRKLLRFDAIDWGENSGGEPDKRAGIGGLLCLAHGLDICYKPWDRTYPVGMMVYTPPEKKFMPAKDAHYITLWADAEQLLACLHDFDFSRPVWAPKSLSGAIRPAVYKAALPGQQGEYGVGSWPLQGLREDGTAWKQNMCFAIVVAALARPEVPVPAQPQKDFQRQLDVSLRGAFSYRGRAGGRAAAKAAMIRAAAQAAADAA